MNIFIGNHAKERAQDRFGWTPDTIQSIVSQSSDITFLSPGETGVIYADGIAIPVEILSNGDVKVITIRLKSPKEN
jgi:hypothetical protein